MSSKKQTKANVLKLFTPKNFSQTARLKTDFFVRYLQLEIVSFFLFKLSIVKDTKSILI
jgi:hypothetical protein